MLVLITGKLVSNILSAQIHYKKINAILDSISFYTPASVFHPNTKVKNSLIIKLLIY